MKPIAALSLLVLLPMASPVLPTYAADPLPPAQLAQAAPSGQTVFGSQLMTPAERQAYRQQMRDAKTPEDRLAICNAHHQAMMERAKEKGVTLPNRAPCARMGMGPKGQGMGGQGMGGGGMGGGGMMGPGSGPGPGPAPQPQDK